MKGAVDRRIGGAFRMMGTASGRRGGDGRRSPRAGRLNASVILDVLTTMRARLSYLHLLFLVADHGGSTAFIDARIARLLDDLSLRQAMLRLDPHAGTQEARIVALFRQELAARAARARRRGIVVAVAGVATALVIAATVARWAL